MFVGSRTETLSPPQGSETATTSYLTIGGETIAVAGSSVIVAGHTLTPGGPAVTVDKAPLSLGSSNIAVGSLTETLPPPQGSVTASSSYLTFGGEPITVAINNIVVARHTQTPGSPAVTIDGTPVSLGSSTLVVGTETMGFTLPAAGASAETGEGIGAMIMYGLTGLGGETAPVETRANNGTMAFMGGALNVRFSLKAWSIWLWALCDLYSLVLER